MRYSTSPLDQYTVGSHTQAAIDAVQTLSASNTLATAIIISVSAPARFRLDGSNPTASLGISIDKPQGARIFPLPTGKQLKIIGESVGAFVDYQFINDRIQYTS